jgi:hypothetical protein
MTPPIRIARAVLSALGAQRDFCDAIIGDIEEEFAERSAADGIAAATRWYLREAIRAAPHLLRDGTRTFGARDVRDLALCVVASLLCVATFSALAGSFAQAIWPNVRGLITQTSSAALALSALAAGTACAVLGGYIAARLHARAPLLGAAALACIWCLLNAVGLAREGHDIMAIYRFGAPLSALLGALFGGVLRAQQAAPRSAA